MFFGQLHRISLRAALVVAVLALTASSAWATGTYQNPFAGDTYTVGRTDMGVDMCLQPGQPIRAIGDGVVTGITRNWYAGQPYIWYELTDGPDTGRYVYVAEQIHHLARVGQQLHAGQTIAVFAKSGSCIETGWGASTGWTLAQVTTGYKEGQVTKAGVSFARFLMSLGVQGTFDLTPTPTHHKHH